MTEPYACDDGQFSANDEMLKLDNQLCFALYVASKEIIKGYKPLLDPLGLTYTMYIAFLALWEHDGILVKDLGKRLYLDSGTLTPLLKKMEAKGWIRRRRRAEDERSVEITLTEEGRVLKERARSVPARLICSSDVDVEKGAALLGMLRTFLDLGLGSR